MPNSFEPCWSAWRNDLATGWRTHLDRGRRDRSAAWIHGSKRGGATVLEQDPFEGHVFVFRGRRGDLIKLLWWDGDGLCLFAKRLERGRFIWPRADSGTVSLTRAQLSMLLEGIDWRHPARTWKPDIAV